MAEGKSAAELKKIRESKTGGLPRGARPSPQRRPRNTVTPEQRDDRTHKRAMHAGGAAIRYTKVGIEATEREVRKLIGNRIRRTSGGAREDDSELGGPDRREEARLKKELKSRKTRLSKKSRKKG